MRILPLLDKDICLRSASASVSERAYVSLMCCADQQHTATLVLDKTSQKSTGQPKTLTHWGDTFSDRRLNTYRTYVTHMIPTDINVVWKSQPYKYLSSDNVLQSCLKMDLQMCMCVCMWVTVVLTCVHYWRTSISHLAARCGFPEQAASRAEQSVQFI